MATQEDTSNYFIGTHEVQECLESEGEASLDFYKKNCKKTHGDYIPVNKFTIEHLPAEYRDKDLYDITKALADITVRINVNYASPERPEFLPKSLFPYPCYDTRGQKSRHTGTGRVLEVTKMTEKPEGTFKHCPCPECVKSDTPSKEWYWVEVSTARHVIFDESEAVQSSCRLWFDDDKSPVVNMKGYCVHLAPGSLKSDIVYMNCALHNMEAGEQLEKTFERYKGLWEKLNDKYKSTGDVERLTIIVSHPHGCSKQISVGYWVDRQIHGISETRYSYTSCTCPGTSGASVYRLGCEWCGHTHSGANSGGLNYSGLQMEQYAKTSGRYLVSGSEEELVF